MTNGAVYFRRESALSVNVSLQTRSAEKVTFSFWIQHKRASTVVQPGCDCGCNQKKGHFYFYCSRLFIQPVAVYLTLVCTVQFVSDVWSAPSPSALFGNRSSLLSFASFNNVTSWPSSFWKVLRNWTINIVQQRRFRCQPSRRSVVPRTSLTDPLLWIIFLNTNYYDKR